MSSLAHPVTGYANAEIVDRLAAMQARGTGEDVMAEIEDRRRLQWRSACRATLGATCDMMAMRFQNVVEAEDEVKDDACQRSKDD